MINCKATYMATFLHPTKTFLGASRSNDSEYTEEYWNEIGSLMNIAETINYPFKSKLIPINIHKGGFISINRQYLKDNFSLIDSPRDKAYIEQAYKIFYSFTGLLRRYYIPEGDESICSFSQDDEGDFHGGNSDKLVELINFNSWHITPREKTFAHMEIFQSHDIGNISDFKKEFNKEIKEKKTLELDEEFYYLISSMYKFFNNKFNEGLLVTGWTGCEYLVNKLFAFNISDQLKEKRKEKVNDITKYPWAFCSKEKLKSYSDLKGSAGFTAKLKMDLLKEEGTLNSEHNDGWDETEFKFYDELVQLRTDRNNFVHDPVKGSEKILSEDKRELLNKISRCMDNLKINLRNLS